MTEQALEKTNLSAYERLCETAKIQPISHPIVINEYSDASIMADKTPAERMTAAMQVFVEMAAGDEGVADRIDRILLDKYIAKIDSVISAQLDEILHHEDFKTLESAWGGLQKLVNETDFKSNIKMEMIDVSKRDLHEDFLDAPDATQSGLYRHVYIQEYDTPGGEPVSAMIANYEFNSGSQDINLLREVAKVASAAHCPFIASAGGEFFHKDSIEDVMRVEDIGNYMDRAEFIRWTSFRETEDARYIGLVTPRFLLRLPYGEDNPVAGFMYEEQVRSENAEKYAWSNSVFNFASNMSRSFKKNGWTVNIRGPEAGGKVVNLPLHQYDVGKGMQTKIPTETIIPETRELEMANLGFIPLSYYKNSDYACFFSANSTQKPAIYTSAEATANSRINSRLPYIFLSSRLGHYLKVLQRENIGSNKNKTELEEELNDWLATLVTEMNNPGPELSATHPLREAKVTVTPIDDNPGFYSVSLYAIPHFQVEGLDITLSMVAQMPGATENT